MSSGEHRREILGMATATMVQPPPPPGRPPSRVVSRGNRPPPPKGAKPPPPPPPPRVDAKRSADQLGSTKSQKYDNKRQKGELTLIRPAVLRDVTVFQKKHQLGQGTYGSVFMGADKDTKDVVALKRINTEQEENGFPITAIREVKILKALCHENIVTLKEIVTSKEQGEIPKNVFMVFEYLEYDLTGVLETPEIRLTQDHIKSWTKQLLAGVHYMHVNKVIHRDLKASNLLINRKGELKIADWGLARSWNKEMKRLTNRVITLWYRPPELLLGCVDYDPKIDMWSVGCIVAEMFRRSGFLKGSNEASQLDIIFRICGHPTVEEWPKIRQSCPLWKNFEPRQGEEFPSQLRKALKQHVTQTSWMTDNAMDLIEKLLTHNPDKRWSAREALSAEYFFENPMVKPANKLAMNFSVSSVHEWEARRKQEQALALRRERMQKMGTNSASVPMNGKPRPPIK